MRSIQYSAGARLSRICTALREIYEKRPTMYNLFALSVMQACCAAMIGALFRRIRLSFLSIGNVNGAVWGLGHVVQLNVCNAFV